MSALLSYVVRKWAKNRLGMCDEVWCRECGWVRMVDLNIGKLSCLAVSHPCIMGFAKDFIMVSGCACQGEWALTLQHVGLQGRGLACTLQRPAINEVQYNAVGKLLSILIRRVRRLELSEVETLGNTLRV